MADTEKKEIITKNEETTKEAIVKKEKSDNKFSRLFKKNPLALIFGIIILILVLVLLFTGVFRSSSNLSTHTKTTNFGLKDVGELVTQTAYTTVVEDIKDSRDFFNLFNIPFSESRQIFSYDIEVDASLDFAKIEVDVDDNSKTVKVNLPHAKIYKATLNPDSLEVYLDSESIFSRIDLTESNEAMKKMEEQAKADSIENGILKAADKNAKVLIENLIRTEDGYSDYKIEYNYIDTGAENEK